MDISYAENFAAKVKPFPNGRIPGLRQDGYGRKISTQYMIRFKGSRHWRRVYQTQISNVGSLWIWTKDGRLFVRDHNLQDAIKSGPTA